MSDKWTRSFNILNVIIIDIVKYQIVSVSVSSLSLKELKCILDQFKIAYIFDLSHLNYLIVDSISAQNFIKLYVKIFIVDDSVARIRKALVFRIIKVLLLGLYLKSDNLDLPSYKHQIHYRQILYKTFSQFKHSTFNL